VLRHHLIVCAVSLKGRSRLTNNDRVLRPDVSMVSVDLEVVTIVHLRRLVIVTGPVFRRYWRWKSRGEGLSRESKLNCVALIPADDTEKPSFGSLASTANAQTGFSVRSSSVAKYMFQRRGPPSHRGGIPFCATTLLTLPPDFCLWSRTLLQTLYGFVVVGLIAEISSDQRTTTRQLGVDRAPDHRGASLDDAPRYISVIANRDL